MKNNIPIKCQVLRFLASLNIVYKLALLCSKIGLFNNWQGRCHAECSPKADHANWWDCWFSFICKLIGSPTTTTLVIVVSKSDILYAFRSETKQSPQLNMITLVTLVIHNYSSMVVKILIWILRSYDFTISPIQNDLNLLRIFAIVQDW